MSWNPDLYHKFRSERSAPFDDLMNLVAVGDGLRVLDLGCGTGELTRMIADRLPASDVLGIDSSPDMLERAKPSERKGLRFELRPIEDVSGDWDLIISNAALHWVDNHDVLIPALFKRLKPGGQIAVQVPSNHKHETQLIVHEIAKESPFADALGVWSRKSPVLSIGAYAEILYKCGGTGIDVFEKVFPHVLKDSDAIADWLAGTMMRPYLSRLTDDLQERFMDRYKERLKGVYAEAPVFYPFRRIFFTAFKTKLHE